MGRRSFASLGLLACALAIVGTGCGGANNKSSNNDGSGGSNGGGGVFIPNPTFNSPRLVVEGARGEINFIASSNVSPGGEFETIPDNPQYLSVSDTKSATLSYPGTYSLLAPRIWADRKFKEWQLNGVTIDTDTVLTFSEIPPSLDGTLKAVYEPYVLPADTEFVPNYLPNIIRIPWSYMPLNVWIDPLLLINPGAEQLFRDGLDKWKLASGGVIGYNIVSSAGAADVRFRSADKFTNLPPEVLGVTIPFQYADNLNANSDFTDIYLLRAQYGAQNMKDRLDYSATVAHEFGHALGLLSHSDDPNDLMSPYSGPLTVTQKDINSLATLYPQFFDGGNTLPTRAAHGSSAGRKALLK